MPFRNLRYEARTHEKRQMLTDCVKMFHSQGIINSYRMTKTEARNCYNNNFTNQNGKTHFSATLYLLNHMKVVKPTDNLQIIHFVPEILDAIIKDTGYIIGNPTRNVLVNQDYATKSSTTGKMENSALSCSTCNIKFETKTQVIQHKSENSHIRNICVQYRRWRRITDNSVLIEIQNGKGNAPETFSITDAQVQARITIKNLNKSPITVQKFTLLNVHLKNNIRFDNFNKIIKETETFNVYFTVPVQKSTLNFSIYFTFLNGDNVIEIVKELYFNYYQKEMLNMAIELQSIAPYEPRKPIIKELDGIVIPSEYTQGSTRFDEKIKLKDYRLEKDMIEALNSGLNAANSPALENSIKKILNNLQPLNNASPENYKKILDLLLYIEEHQMKINIRSYDTVEELHKIKNSNLFKLMVPELSEHRPSLLMGDSVFISDSKSNIKYQGIVENKNMDNVHLRFSRSFSDIYLQKKKFNIAFTYNRRTIKVEHQAVNLLNNEMIKRFFPVEYVGSNEPRIHSITWFNNKIKDNKEQQIAVEHILYNTSHPLPYIIFGPPGTGKTMTIVEAIMQIWKLKKDKKVLICTPSNSAANVVALRLAKVIPATDMLRYLSISTSINEVPEEITKYCNYDRDEYYYPSVRQIMQYQIVISTLTNSARFYNAGMEKNHFSYVFLDESGHAAETETLVPITSVLNNTFGSIILTGDPQQLGPIIHSTIAKKYGFEKSMLERLMTNTEIYSKKNGVYDSNVLTKLLKNYRSHPVIIKIPNAKFYDGELDPVGNELSNFALNSEILINKKFPMIFHSVIGNEEREANSPSFFNVHEVLIIAQYLKKLIGNRINGYLVKEYDIGIIAPYRKQVEKIKKTLRTLNFQNVMTGSVEQFQGQEKLIIIISTVRSKPDFLTHDTKYHLGFLENPKRFNVAITRAKALVIVVGNHTILQNDHCWRAYIEECIKNNSCVPPNINLFPPNPPTDPNELNFDQINIQDDDSVNFSRGNV